MKKLFILTLALLLSAWAHVRAAEETTWPMDVTITWPMAEGAAESHASVISDGAEGMLSASEPTLGSEMSWKAAKTVNEVKFTTVKPSAQVGSATPGHTVTFSIETKDGYMFEPSGFDYIACVDGTDGGKYDLNYEWNGKTNNLQSDFHPNRNNEANGWFSEVTLPITNGSIGSGKFDVTFSIYNLGDTKAIGLSNVVIKGKLRKTTEYTLNYVSDNQIIKTTTKSGIVGEPVEVTDLEKLTFTNDDNTIEYTYVSDDSEGLVVSDGDATVVTIQMSASELDPSLAKTWDFTKWSTATVSNLIADSNWSDDEKGDGKTNITNNNCLWQVSKTAGLTSYNSLMANNEIIKELEGLALNNGKDRSLAIAVNYPSTSLGSYNGPSYIWLGDASTTFTIPNVPAGATIKIGVESHKNSEGRGVKLSINGTELTAPDGSTVTPPTTYDEQEWIVPAEAASLNDVLITPTKGCHIYFIDVTPYEKPVYQNYTLKYVVDGETVKEVTKRGVVGEAIALTADDKAEISVTEGDVTTKYVYVSDDSENLTIDADGNTVVTLTYNVPPKWNYTIKNNVNDEVKTGSCEQGATVVIPYSRYILADDGTVYQKAVFSTTKNTQGYNEYQYYFTPKDDNEELELTYSPSKITNGIWFSEAEEIKGLEPSTNGNTPIRCSNAAGGYSKDGNEVDVYTLKSGKYKVAIGVWGNKTQDFIVKAGEKEVLKATTTGSWFESTSEEFKILTDTALTFGGATETKPLDYILVYGQEIAAADYTVKFIDENGEELKSAVTGRGFVGDPINISDEDKANFEKDGKFYFFDSIDPETTTISDGENVVTVKFHEAEKGEYTVKYVDSEGTEIKDAETFTGAVGFDIKLSEDLKQFIIVKGKIYVYVEDDLAEDQKLTAEGSTVTITYRLPNLGEEFTIVDETFTGDDLSASSVYTWGDQIQDMIVVNKTSSRGPAYTGLYMTNESNKDKNYENRDFLDFSGPIGDANNMLDISYKVFSPYNKTVNTQKETYYTINYFNKEGDFIFGIQEASSGETGYTANVITANADKTTTTIALPAGHMKQSGGSVVNVTVKFTEGKAVVGIDGGNYVAYTKSEGIKSVKLSVTGDNGYDRDMNVENYTLKAINAEAVKTADVTLKYVVGEDTIKEETVNGVVGLNPSLTAGQTADFYSEDKSEKYIYVSDDSKEQTVDEEGTTVVTLTYKKANKFSYTIKNNVNDDKEEGNCIEGESVTVYFNKYILAENGTVWSKDVANDKEHKESFTPDVDGFVYTLEYTETDIKNGIFFKEAEDEYYTENNVLIATSTSGNRGSNKLGGYTDKESATLYTLLPGTYNVEIGAIGPSENGAILVLNAGDEAIITTTALYSKLGKYSTSSPVTIKTKTDLTIEGTNKNNVLDYILITGTVGIPVEDIKLTKSTETMTLGEDFDFEATITPEYATDADIEWSSNNEAVAEVDQNGKVTAVGVGTATITATAGDKTATCEVKVYPQTGDANHDGKLDISDAVDITNYVVGRKEEMTEAELEFYKKGANANGDAEGRITFADASAAAEMVLVAENAASAQSRIRATYDESTDALVIGRASSTSRGNVIPVALDNSEAYVALQADIYMPAGVNFEVKAANGTADTHTFMTKKHADDHIRVVLFNLGNNAFAAGDAPILEIVTDSNVSASEIVISNIIVSDADAKGTALTSKTAATNGVAALGFDENEPVKVFDVNGIYVGDTMEGLSQGTYIIRQGENSKKVYLR